MNNTQPPQIVSIIFFIIGSVFSVIGFFMMTIIKLINEPALKPYALAALVPIILGLSFITAATIIIILFKKKRRMHKELKNSGKRVYATITEVTKHRYFVMNRRRPFIINATWKDPVTEIVHTYESASIWANPEALIKQKGLTELPVYMDRESPHIYVVDLDLLTKANRKLPIKP